MLATRQQPCATSRLMLSSLSSSARAITSAATAGGANQFRKQGTGGGAAATAGPAKIILCVLRIVSDLLRVAHTLLLCRADYEYSANIRHIK
jgi:hypothetical protein